MDIKETVSLIASLVLLASLLGFLLTNAVCGTIMLLNMKEKNLREAMVLRINREIRLDVAGHGIRKPYFGYFCFTDVGGRLSVGEMCDVYQCDALDNRLFRMSIKGVIPAAAADDVKPYIIKKTILCGCMSLFIIAPFAILPILS